MVRTDEKHIERLQYNCKILAQAMQLSPKFESIVSDTFVETLYTLKCRPLPEEVVLEARKCMMDEIGTMLAGAKLLSGQLSCYLDCFTGEDATEEVIDRVFSTFCVGK